jgi:diguanylate cyclase (GGDEF)-like protein/PAS domain S-box-containing protein
VHELDTILSSIGPDVLIVIDADRNITLCNGAVERMYGYSKEETLGAKTDLLYFDRRLDKGKNEIRDDLQEKGFHVGRARGRRRNGELFPLEVITATLVKTPGAVLLLRDITERERLEAQLVRFSTHDELTGLLNRRGFFEAGLQQLKFAKRYRMEMFLLFADLDKFKEINDTLGHQVGDVALMAAAEVLQTCLRDADIVGRLGGDEFAVLGVADKEGKGEAAIARLNQVFEDYRDPQNRFRLAASMGIAHFGTDSDLTLDELTSEADAKMYAAKMQRKAGANKSA